MKNFFTLLLFTVSFASCKKMVDAVQEDLIVKAMTEGQWKVTRFTKDTSNITSGFTPYTFQFRPDKSVEAIRNGTIESTGNWNGSAATRTISSSFTYANATLSLLNGSWQITNNSWTFVEARQTVNNEVLTLRLDK